MIQDIITVIWALLIFDTIKLFGGALVLGYRMYKEEKLKRTKLLENLKDIDISKLNKKVDE